MVDTARLNALAQADLILQVDATRSRYDLFELPAWLLPLVTTRLADGRAANGAVALAPATARG